MTTAAVILAVLLSIEIGAQSAPADDTDLQLWNDVQLKVPVNDKFDVNTEFTARIKNNISLTDTFRLKIGVTYKPTKDLSVAPFTTFISTRNAQGHFRYEYRSGLDAVYRFPVPKVRVSHRSRFEHRIRPGRNSWRYRPSITVKVPLSEKLVRNTSIFVTEEPFYDSVSGKFSRNRISTGIERVVNKHFTFELYYLFQGDNFSRPGTVHVLGTAWKFSL